MQLFSPSAGECLPASYASSQQVSFRQLLPWAGWAKTRNNFQGLGSVHTFSEQQLKGCRHPPFRMLTKINKRYLLSVVKYAAPFPVGCNHLNTISFSNCCSEKRERNGFKLFNLTLTLQQWFREAKKTNCKSPEQIKLQPVISVLTALSDSPFCASSDSSDL